MMYILMTQALQGHRLYTHIALQFRKEKPNMVFLIAFGGNYVMRTT